MYRRKYANLTQRIKRTIHLSYVPGRSVGGFFFFMFLFRKEPHVNQSVAPPPRLQTYACLSPAEMQMVFDVLPWEVVATLFAFPQLFVAGGCIRAAVAGEEVKDIDIFTTDLAVVDKAVEFLLTQRERRGGDAVERATPCTRTVVIDGLPVQFINNVAYASPVQCIETFDFTICQAAFWHGTNGQWQSHSTPEFHRDVALKRLVYTAPDRAEAPGGSLWRAFKYVRRGYSITQRELARLVVRLNESLDSGEHVVSPWKTVKAKTHEVEDVANAFRMPGVLGGSY